MPNKALQPTVLPPLHGGADVDMKLTSHSPLPLKDLIPGQPLREGGMGHSVGLAEVNNRLLDIAL